MAVVQVGSWILVGFYLKMSIRYFRVDNSSVSPDKSYNKVYEIT